MAKGVFTDINLNGNQIRNVAVDNVSSLPSSPCDGQFVFLSQTDGDYDGGNIYYYDGNGWVCMSSQYPFVDLSGYNEHDVVSYQNVVEKLKNPSVVVMDGGYFYSLVGSNAGTWSYVCNDSVCGCSYIILSEYSGGTLRVEEKGSSEWPAYYDGVLSIDMDNTGNRLVLANSGGHNVDVTMNSGQTTDITLQLPSSGGTLATESFVRGAFVWTECE